MGVLGKREYLSRGFGVMINSPTAANSKPFITVSTHTHMCLWAQTGVDCITTTPNKHKESQHKEKDGCRDMRTREKTNDTHPHTHTRDQTRKSWSLRLLNIPPVDCLPPLCLHSPGTNTKLSQGHLQDCFGQQFLPNSLIASSVTACLTFTHTQS